MTKQEIDERNKLFAYAFNMGSDARIEGQPLTANPIKGDPSMSWRWGWMDVDRHFGELAKWPYRRLPEVK